MKTPSIFMAAIIAAATTLPALAEVKKNPDNSRNLPNAQAGTSAAPGKPVRAESNQPIPGIDVVVQKQSAKKSQNGSQR